MSYFGTVSDEQLKCIIDYIKFNFISESKLYSISWNLSPALLVLVITWLVVLLRINCPRRIGIV